MTTSQRSIVNLSRSLAEIGGSGLTCGILLVHARIERKIKQLWLCWNNSGCSNNGGSLLRKLVEASLDFLHVTARICSA